MSLNARQTKLMELMTTRHHDLILLCLKCLLEILEAPENERIGMVEVFLYGYPIPFDTNRPANDDELDINENDLSDGQLSVRLLMESGVIQSLRAIENTRPAFEVALSLVQDLKALSPHGQWAQLALLVHIINAKFLPYLGAHEVPRLDKIPVAPIRQALLANPRLYAIYIRAFQGVKAPSADVAAMMDHVLMKECQTAEQRQAFLMTVLQQANPKRGWSPVEHIIEEVRSHLDVPVDPKTAS